MILDKNKFLLMVLIFSLTANVIQMVKIKHIDNALLACETKRLELVSIININKRITDAQNAKLVKLQQQLTTQDMHAKAEIARVLSAPEDKSCLDAIRRGVAESRKHPVVSGN